MYWYIKENISNCKILEYKYDVILKTVKYTKQILSVLQYYVFSHYLAKKGKIF